MRRLREGRSASLGYRLDGRPGQHLRSFRNVKLTAVKYDQDTRGPYRNNKILWG